MIAKFMFGGLFRAQTARRGRAAGEQGHKRSYWVDVLAALAALALLLLLVPALLLLLLLLLSLWLRRLQCLMLAILSRFPFHDSQIYVGRSFPLQKR